MSAVAQQSGLPAVFSLRGVVLAALAYSAVNAIITLAAGPALALDDVKLNVLAQSLQGGYLPDNPPLFEWMLVAVQRLTGPTLASFAIVKYFLLTMTAAFTFLAVREATGDRTIATVAALLLPLIPQIGWSFHQTLTHSTALIAAVAVFWFALLRLARTRTVSDYAILGIAIGLGALSKYSFPGAAAIAIAAAAAVSPWLRAGVINPRLAVSLIVAVLIASPHIAWLLSSDVAIGDMTRARLVGGAGYLSRLGEGLPAALWAVISFFAPLGAVSFGVDRSPLRIARGSASALFVNATVLAIAALACGVLVFGVTNIQERYAIAFLYPGYLGLIILVFRTRPAEHLAPTLLAFSLVVAVTAAAVRTAAVLRPGAPFCSKCREQIPYDSLAAALGDVDGTLVSFDDHTAGNLRRLYPSLRILSSHLPLYTPPVIDGSGRCFFIWSADLSPPPPPGVTTALTTPALFHASGVWRKTMNGEPQARATHWSIATVDPASELGNSLCRQ